MQSAAGNARGTSITATFGSNTTTGNLIIVALQGDATFSSATISDSQSNTYNSLYNGAPSGGAGDFAVWYAYNITGGTNTVTANLGRNIDCEMIIQEFSGTGSSAPLDLNTTPNTGTSATYSTGTSGTTAQASEIIVAIAGQRSGTAISSVSSPYSNFNNSNSAFGNVAIASQVVSSTGTQSATFSGPNTAYQAMIASFKLSGGGGAVNTTNFFLD